LVNEVRGLLAEFGLVEPRKGVAAARELLRQAIDTQDNGLPGPMCELLRDLNEELLGHDERVKRLMAIEGVGPISSTVVVGCRRRFATVP
jgi:transposase